MIDGKKDLPTVLSRAVEEGRVRRCTGQRKRKWEKGWLAKAGFSDVCPTIFPGNPRKKGAKTTADPERRVLLTAVRGTFETRMK